MGIDLTNLISAKKSISDAIDVIDAVQDKDLQKNLFIHKVRLMTYRARISEMLSEGLPQVTFLDDMLVKRPRTRAALNSKQEA